MPWNRKYTLLTGGALSLALGAFFAGRAVAAGVPDTEPLTYSGTLASASGTLLTGDRDILLRFWDAASDGDVVCTRPKETITLTLGRFSLPLPDECTEAVKENPDLWVEVVVDDVSLGLAKLGAVPFAMEAGHATTATSATSATRADRASLVHVKGGFTDVRLNTTTHPTPANWALVTGRSLTFNKRYASSLLKVTYQDTLGTLGTLYAGCTWRIVLDDGVIAQFSDADADGAAVWKMSNASHTAWAAEVGTGSHTVKVEWQGNRGAWDNTTECLAGWNSSGGFLSVEEINPLN